MFNSGFSASLLLITGVFSSPLLAQITITGTVQDAANQPANYANVVLLAAADSTYLDGAVTNASGIFQIRSAAATGECIVRVSSIGYADMYSQRFNVKENNKLGQPLDVGTLLLGSVGTELAVATVTAKLPLVERRADRTIINVANQPTAIGQTALQVLERSPGVFVDRNSNTISMLGKSGVQVMINGRMNYMPAEALLAFLAGIPAVDIIRFELITVPQANLDAEGNAGYIDIVLRRLPDEGLRGNYSVMAGFGGNHNSNQEYVYGEHGSANVSATYRRSKVSAFGGLSYLRDATPQASFLRRTAASTEGTQTVDFTWDRDNQSDAVNYRIGADYQISERTTIGILSTGYFTFWQMDATQRNRFSIGGRADTLLLTNLRELNDWFHAQGGLSLSQKLAGDASLQIGLDYLYYDNSNPVDYALRFTDISEQSTYRVAQLASRKDSPFGIWVSSLDYKRPLGQGTLNLGAKYVVSDFENTVSLDRDGVRDEGFSSVSILNESIAAGYAQYAGKATLGANKRAIDYQLGVRYEHTDTQLDEVGVELPVVDRNYGRLFPSFAVGYDLSEDTKVTAGYSRRIERPSFTDMAPFVIFLTPTTSFGGNPALQPAISNTFEAGIQRGGITLALSYTNIDSAIVSFQTVYDPTDGSQLIKPLNLRSQEVYAASLGLPTKLSSWWNGQINATLSYTEAVVVLPSSVIQLDATNLQLSGSQNFTLAEGLSLSASGYFLSPSLSGYNRVNALGALNLALQKKLTNGTLTLGVDDVLDTNRIRVKIDDPVNSLTSDFGFDFSGPTARITWSAGFGNSRVKELNRESAAEERGRVN